MMRLVNRYRRECKCGNDSRGRGERSNRSIVREC